MPVKKATTAKSAAIVFRTTLLTAGKTAVGIHVPDDVVEQLGGGKRAAVRITLNGYTYRNTLAVMGGRSMVGVSAENREAAGVAGGDKLDVGIALDTAPREVTVPAEFAKVLGKHAKAKKAFEALSYSKQKAIVVGIDGAKTEETRQRRIEKALGELE